MKQYKENFRVHYRTVVSQLRDGGPNPFHKIHQQTFAGMAANRIDRAKTDKDAEAFVAETHSGLRYDVEGIDRRLKNPTKVQMEVMLELARLLAIKVVSQNAVIAELKKSLRESTAGALRKKRPRR